MSKISAVTNRQSTVITTGQKAEGATAATAADPVTIKRLFTDQKDTHTKSGWCLKQGLIHIASVDNRRLLPLIEQHGIPSFYNCVKKQNSSIVCRHAPTQDIKDPSTSFESLCRIIAGQFVSGTSAQAAWKRLLKVVDDELTPDRILSLVENKNSDDNNDDGKCWETHLQQPVGLTRAKAKSIVDLAQHFVDGHLSEDFFSTANEIDIRSALLKVRGIGPWSCDMFLQFYLEQSNVLPLADLGVRKGLAKQFGIPADAHKKREGAVIRERLALYEPYLSLVTYYMWRAVDTPPPPPGDDKEDSQKKILLKTAVATAETIPAQSHTTTTLSSTCITTPSKRRRISKRVTP